MAIVTGTNAGLVESTPSTDPEGSGQNVSGISSALKFTTTDAITITEIGWYQSDAGVSATNYQMALYTHDAANDLPEDKIADSDTSGSVAASTAAWYGDAISVGLSASTVYWVVVHVDGGGADADQATSGGTRFLRHIEASLSDPFTNSPTVVNTNYNAALYVKYVAAGGTQGVTTRNPLWGPLGGPLVGVLN